MTMSNSSSEPPVGTFASNLLRFVEKSPYDALGAYQRIIDNRAALGGSLFIDHMASDIVKLPSSESNGTATSAKVGALEAWQHLYPPANKEGALKLLEAIESRTKPGMPTTSLIYYIFLDYPKSLTSGESLPVYYAEVTDLPAAYDNLIRGFHSLDQKDFKTGLVLLSQPDIIPSYTEQVISAFIQAQIQNLTPPPNTSNGISQALGLPRTFSAGGYSMAIAYVSTKSPQLINQDSIESYVKVLCRTSLYTALEFIRCVNDVSPESEQPAEEESESNPYDKISSKTALLTVMIKTILDASPNRAAAAPSDGSNHRTLFRSAPMAWRFTNLPFTTSESEVVSTILLNIVTLATGPRKEQEINGSASALLKNSLQWASLAKSILLVRALHTGNTELATKVAALGSSSSVASSSTNGPSHSKYGAPEFNDLAKGIELWNTAP